MRRWASQITLIEKVVGCLFAFLLVEWGEFAFSGAVYLLMAGAVAGVLAATSGRLLLVKAWCLVGVVCVVGGLIELRGSQPLRQQIAGKSFHDAPVSEVLQFLARQNTSSPTWRFSLYGPDFASSRISVEFPENTTLGVALQLLSEALDCDYGYRWSKICGNALAPGSAGFWISRDGNMPLSGSTPEAVIFARNIDSPMSHPSATPSPAPPSLPAANP